jgi:hypothetical protein
MIKSRSFWKILVKKKKIVEEIDSVRIAKHEHSEETKSHCVETHVDDLIEVKK